MNDNLPPLPEPILTHKYEGSKFSPLLIGPCFSLHQMREYGQLCRQQALEAAAKVCDDFAGRPDINYSETCAVFIRSLK